METHKRTLAKTISWRIVATLTTVFLVFVFTGNLVLSSGVGLAEVITKLVVYYVHERVWNIIGFGRVKKSNQ